METTYTHREDLDRLVFLLASEPRLGWEDIYEAARRREIERLAVPSEGQVGRDG